MVFYSVQSDSYRIGALSSFPLDFLISQRLIGFEQKDDPSAFLLFHGIQRALKTSLGYARGVINTINWCVEQDRFFLEIRPP